MAGSRNQKIGTIFTRVTGLLKSGALKQENRPLWYDIYEAFPPKYEPRFDRPAVPKQIPNIFYNEDTIRARFYRTYPNAVVDMKSDIPSICQRFVEKFVELEKQGLYKTEMDLFEAVASTMALRTTQEKPVNIPQVKFTDRRMEDVPKSPPEKLTKELQRENDDMQHTDDNLQDKNIKIQLNLSSLMKSSKNKK